MNKFFGRTLYYLSRYIYSFVLILVTLLGRLFYIQVIDDPTYLSSMPKGQCPPAVLSLTLHAAPILDRNGKILVQNQPFYDINVTPNLIKSPFDTADFCKLCMNVLMLLNSTGGWPKAIKYSKSQQSVFEKQLTPEAYAGIQERLSEFTGFNGISPLPLRTYPDSVAAQFLGYIGERYMTMTSKKAAGYYHPRRFYWGVTGVERSYESVLRGQARCKLYAGRLRVENPKG